MSKSLSQVKFEELKLKIPLLEPQTKHINCKGVHTNGNLKKQLLYPQ
jgi:hypothetical protein